MCLGEGGIAGIRSGPSAGRRPSSVRTSSLTCHAQGRRTAQSGQEGGSTWSSVVMAGERPPCTQKMELSMTAAKLHVQQGMPVRQGTHSIAGLVLLCIEIYKSWKAGRQQ